MTKVQLTLTTQEVDLLSLKAATLGYNLTRFIKFLISREAAKVIEENNIPVFKMSKKAERIALQAIKNHQAGKTILLKNIEDLDNL